LNREEARALLAEKVLECRRLSYSQLLELLNNPIGLELVGASGTRYGVEVEAFWDREPEPDLRIVASIDDGGWSSLSPLTDDFIILPDGSFVGE